jgi:hypothetical protein
MITHFRLAELVSEGAKYHQHPMGGEKSGHIPAGKAQKFQLVTVDIFGGCLPRIQPSEEYLSNSAGNPLF